jgi:hypothetical protein
MPHSGPYANPIWGRHGVEDGRRERIITHVNFSFARVTYFVAERARGGFMAAFRPGENLSPAPAAVRFAWAMALTPVGGIIGFALGMLIFQYWFWHPAPSPYYLQQRPPWWNELGALAGIGLFTSLFAWPVTLVAFPFVRGRFPTRSWKSLCVICLSGLVTGIVAPVPMLLLSALLRRINPYPFDWVWFYGAIGSGSGFLTAIPYYFLTNPRQRAISGINQEQSDQVG